MKNWIRSATSFIENNKAISFLLVFAFVFQMGMMLPYALYQCRNGLCGFWYPNASAAHDDSWIMAIASVSFKSIPFVVPIYTGVLLQGYHYISAFFVSILSFSGITIHTIFYGVVPLVWFFLIVKIILILTKKISNTFIFKFIFIFLFFFGGSFSYLFILFHKLPLFYPYVISGRQSVDFFQSMPLAFSLIPFLVSILYLYSSKKLSLRKRILVLGLVIFFAWGSKFYGGVAVATTLCTFEFLEVIKSKHERKSHVALLLVCIVASLISIYIFFNPFGSHTFGKGIFIFSPFAITHSLIEEKNAFYLPRVALARYSLQAHGWGPRLLVIEISTWILFIFFTFGIRILGFIYILGLLLKRKLSTIDISLIASTIVCLIGGTMFIQRVDWWNSGQFLDYPKIILSLYVALGLAKYFEKKRNVIKTILVSTIIILSIYNSLQGFIGRATYKEALVLSQNQIAALEFLKKLPSGSVFTLPFDRFKTTTSVHVEDNIDTVYIPIISKKEMYYSTPHQLDLTSIDYSYRKNIIDQNILTQPYVIDVDYFYINKSNELYSKVRFESNYFTKLFENRDVVIFRKKILSKF